MTAPTSFSVQLVAGCFIQRGCQFGPLEDVTFTNLEDRDLCQDKRIIKIFAYNNTLIAEDEHSQPFQHWSSCLSPAGNVIEQNLQLFRARDNLYIRVCRDIEAGERMMCWYDEPLSMEKHVPHLTPVNIQGGQRYVCSHCDEVFLYPNMLKIHIMFHCQKNNTQQDEHKDVLKHWPVLTNGCTLDNSVWNSARSYTCSSSSSKVTMPPGLTVNIQNPCQHQHRCSFIIRSCTRCARSNYGGIPQNTTPTLKEQSGQSVKDTYQHVKPEDEPIAEEPMEMLSKTFMEFSTKDGYICVYCGKLYSRKYGLKIHLRTHTGYKPLKCKVCFRAFGDPSNLNKHIRLHAQGSAPYKCKHCGKILVRRRDLLRHVKSRHPNKTNES